MDTLQLLEETFAPISGRRILDIGCGIGLLARALGKRGAIMAGVDPDPAALAKARLTAPDAAFSQGSAERLPFEAGSFDGSVFLNSLHHVAPNAMTGALREAGRVTAASGLVVVIEPLAEGSFFEAFLPVEDETEVRRLAQAAIDDALSRGLLQERSSLVYNRVERFDDVAAFISRVTAGDAARLDVAAKNAEMIEEAFARLATRDGAGRYVLEQPLLARILEPGPDAP